MTRFKNPFFLYGLLLIITAVNAIFSLQLSCKSFKCFEITHEIYYALICASVFCLVCAYFFMQVKPTGKNLKLFMVFLMVQLVFFEGELFSYKFILLNYLSVSFDWVSHTPPTIFNMKIMYIADLFNFNSCFNSSLNNIHHNRFGLNLFSVFLLYKSYRLFRVLEKNPQ